MGVAATGALYCGRPGKSVDNAVMPERNAPGAHRNDDFVERCISNFPKSILRFHHLIWEVLTE